jgi:hypothetical protein
MRHGPTSAAGSTPRPNTLLLTGLEFGGDNWRLISAAFGHRAATAELKGTLELTVGGPEFPHEENGKTAGRDYQFELASAAGLKLADFNVRLEGEANLFFDVGATESSSTAEREPSRWGPSSPSSAFGPFSEEASPGLTIGWGSRRRLQLRNRIPRARTTLPPRRSRIEPESRPRCRPAPLLPALGRARSATPS